MLAGYNPGGSAPFKVRVVPAEDKSFQPLGFPDHIRRGCFPLLFQKVPQSVHCFRNRAVDDRGVPNRAHVVSDRIRKRLELLHRIRPLVCERFLETDPSFRCDGCHAVTVGRCHNIRQRSV